MGEEEPEPEDGFGKDIKDSVCDDLGVDVDVAGSISNAPDAMKRQLLDGLLQGSDLTLGRWSKGSG